MTTTYDASAIQALSGLQHVRQRPLMYLGSAGVGVGGEVELRDPLLRVRLASSLQRLVVFTHAGSDCITMEPVSHVNNAINLMGAGSASADALGVRVLQPGESMSAEMSIHVEKSE